MCLLGKLSSFLLDSGLAALSHYPSSPYPNSPAKYTFLPCKVGQGGGERADDDDRTEAKMFARGYKRDTGYRSPREPGLVRTEELGLQGKRDNRAGGTRQGRGRGSSTESHFRQSEINPLHRVPM